METNAQPRKPLNIRTAWPAVVGGLLGGVVGQFAASPILSLFGDSPKWLAPVVIVGFIAIFITGVLLLPLVLRPRADK